MERIRQVLGDIGYEVTSAELLDILWLTRVMERGRPDNARPRSAPDAPAPEPVDRPAVEPPLQDVSAAPPPTAAPLATQPSPRTRGVFTAVAPEGVGRGDRASGVRVPGPRAIGGGRALGRELRRLRRYRNHPHETVTDVEATIRSTAECGVLDVVCRPTRELRHAAVVLVDDSESMRVWRPLVREFQRLLERIGTFREVHVRRIDPTGLGHRRQLQNEGSSVVFLVTDGIHAAWRTPGAGRWAARWNRTDPLVIVNPLPRRLWRGTAFEVDTHLLRTDRPFSGRRKNDILDPLSRLPLTDRADRPVFPIVELSTPSVAAWVSHLTRPGGAHLLDTATLGGSGPTGHPERQVDPSAAAVAEPQEIFAEELIARFRGSFSPQSYQLAVRLSTIRPLSLPVMQLVRLATLPESGTAHVAEVLLGGLLQSYVPHDDEPPLVLGPLEDTALYDFKPGVRSLLSSGLSTEATIEALEAVGKALEPQLGRLPDFAALVPDSDGGLLLPEGASAFAAIAAPALERVFGLGSRAPAQVEGASATPSVRPVVVILTTLPVEYYAAVLDHLEHVTKIVHPRHGIRAHRGQLPGVSWQVAVVDLVQGAAAADALTEAVVGWLAPEAVLFVGTAGSLKDDIEIGDVVVATKLYTILDGDRTDDFASRPEALPASVRLEQAARKALRGRARFKPVAVGDVAHESGEAGLTWWIRSRYHDAVAVETGSSGMAHAVRLADLTDWLVIRGISDAAHAVKSGARAEGSRSLAAANAAAAAMDVVRELSRSEVGSGAAGEQSVVAGESLPARRDSEPTVLSALPPAPAAFTGRHSEMQAILEMLEPGNVGQDTPVVITAVSGLGGVGKTALAVQAAHTSRKRGWFPGGTLFIDLHGYDEVPVTGGRALQSLLRALGVQPEHIPLNTDDRAALYRSVMARRAEDVGPLLIVADNASSSEQIRPLVPGGEHRVLVTSRLEFSQLAARVVHLDVLAQDDALALLDRELRIADPDDSRVVEEPEAAAALAALCGYLPLALQIVAAQLTFDPGMPIGEFVAELSESRSRLDHLDDGERSIRSAFDMSYRRLPQDQARMLRLLALTPGTETGTDTVAALAGQAPQSAYTSLAGLAGVHFVERGSRRRTWRMHGLVRAYANYVWAADPVHGEEVEVARERLLAFYCHQAEAADRRLTWLPGHPEPERFATRAEALEWLDTERPGLVGAVQWAAVDLHADAAVRLASHLGTYLAWRRYFDDWVAVSSAALEAARRMGDRSAEAAAWNNLGLALWESERVEEAIDAQIRARDLQQATGNRRGEAEAWSNLGMALRKAVRLEESVDAQMRARDLYQSLDDRHGEAAAWNALGGSLGQSGRGEEAVDAQMRARDLYQMVGDRHGEAVARFNLGVSLRATGRVEESLETYHRALAIFREFEDSYREGRTLESLARTCESVGRRDEARAFRAEAVDAFSRAGATAEAARVAQAVTSTE
jgi:nucleoside phosphorylase/tetratricopeptide (TPR) repeat protein